MQKCFTKKVSESVASLSEGALIKRFCKNLAPFVPQAPYGAGDDCALIEKKSFDGKILSTSDAVILGRHFTLDTPAQLAGQKLLNRNISDIASMGGLPKFAMTSCIISPKLSLDWLDKFCAGLKKAASVYNIKFIGGDVTRGGDDFFSMHITLLGDAKKPLLRTGAKDCDKIYVTGSLGASFESQKHLTFTPRVKEGQFLANCKYVNCCTDLSDGLASDLRDILPAKFSATLNNIPLFDFPKNTLKKALCDGEDYELLFTLSADANAPLFEKKFEKALGYKPICVGFIHKSKKSEIFIQIDGAKKLLKEYGFKHF